MIEAQPEGPYNLLGYSYGATVAFQMAIHMQQSHPNTPGVVKSLILLDGSHTFMQTYRKIWRIAYNVNTVDTDTLAFESEVLCAFAMRFVNIDYKLFRQQLMSCADWDTRISTVVDKVMTR